MTPAVASPLGIFRVLHMTLMVTLGDGGLPAEHLNLLFLPGLLHGIRKWLPSTLRSNDPQLGKFPMDLHFARPLSIDSLGKIFILGFDHSNFHFFLFLGFIS